MLSVKCHNSVYPKEFLGFSSLLEATGVPIIPPMRLNLMKVTLLALIATASLTGGCATSKQTAALCPKSGATSQVSASAPPTKAVQEAITPDEALAQLKAGNGRFVTGTAVKRDLTAERAATVAGQYPFAVVLSCVDSRTSSELIFDQGLGDIFNARIAGNILNDDILGSMEFACKVAGAKLIAVVGHTKCGAVKGACTGAELGHLTGLLAKIQPAVAAAPAAADKADYVRVDAVAAENVKLVMAQIKERSPVLAEMIRDGKVALTGGIHDLQSGKVNFFP
jgi:carbonic anhydrase